MDYKKGDKVFIYLQPRKRYPAGVSIGMKAFNYTVAKITDTKTTNEYRINLDNGQWVWNSEMFLSLDDFPQTIHSKIFGDITINKISDLNDEYPIEVILQDGDIINLTKDFRYFKDSERNIM